MQFEKETRPSLSGRVAGGGRPLQVDLLDGAVALEEPPQRRSGRPRGQVGQEERPPGRLQLREGGALLDPGSSKVLGV